MRTAFIQQLTTEARRNPRIFLVVGDLGFSVVEPFAAEFPDRFLNAGVAEQNMTGVAAGLASEGYHVFTYSIANFPTFRCAEQIRNDIAYHNLPVTVVAVGGGLAYGNLGYSHHAVQDLALMRSFPGMLMACPGDPHEARAVVSYLSRTPQPSYLRLGKAGEPEVHSSAVEVAPGKILWARGVLDSQQVVLTTGAGLKIAERGFAEAGCTGWALGSVPLWNTANQGELLEQLKNRRALITVEDHLRIGGFGSFIRELMDDKNPRPRIKTIALSHDVCGQVGNQAMLSKTGGVSPQHVSEALRELV